ncbi:MAG TPA: response regulator transcription factor [Candidatus Micrarchaeia archaeon]|nr:response regulator transcription factor [Candidatus Micrarchaeia archaeon]
MPRIPVPLVLVVDDDPRVAETVAALLRPEGYAVKGVQSGSDALAAMTASQPDCLVVDWAMPTLSGLEMVRRLRQQGSTVPVVMLSARGDAIDRMAGYDAGVDIYVDKSEDPGILRAAVRRLLQRQGGRPTRFDHPGLTIDSGSWTCVVDGHPVALPRRLFLLLHLLAGQPGQVLRKEQIVYQVWGVDSDVYNRAVDNAVAELRRLLGEPPGAPRFIHTVRGIGYKFEVVT